MITGDETAETPPAAEADGTLARERSFWRKVMWSGCGCLSLVAAVLLAAIVLNRGSIGSWFQRSASDLSELAAVQRKLSADYGTLEVFVQWRSTARRSLRHGGKSSGRRLFVRLVNPPFLADLPLERAEPKAQEIARAARKELRHPSQAPPVEVMLVQRTGVGVFVIEQRTFVFEGDELTSER